jgi:hypothetical protein
VKPLRKTEGLEYFYIQSSPTRSPLD